MHVPGASALKNAGCLGEGGASGHNIINQKNGAACKFRLMLGAKDAAYVAQARVTGAACCLGAHGTHASQIKRANGDLDDRRNLCGQQGGLVKAPFPLPTGVERNRNNDVCGYTQHIESLAFQKRYKWPECVWNVRIF